MYVALRYLESELRCIIHRNVTLHWIIVKLFPKLLFLFVIIYSVNNFLFVFYSLMAVFNRSARLKLSPHKQILKLFRKPDRHFLQILSNSNATACFSCPLSSCRLQAICGDLNCWQCLICRATSAFLVPHCACWLSCHCKRWCSNLRLNIMLFELNTLVNVFPWDIHSITYRHVTSMGYLWNYCHVIHN